MKKLSGIALLYLVMGAAALADGVIYHIFVDGLACEQCARDIDEQLRKIDGVERVDTLPGKGIVNVRMADGHALDEKQVARVVAGAGVTFRRVEAHPVTAAGVGKQENSL